MHELPGIIALIGFFGSIMTGILALGPIGRAIGDRVRGKALGSSLGTMQEQLDEVIARLDEVQQQLADLGERQDFAERMLAKAKDRGLLEAGK